VDPEEFSPSAEPIMESGVPIIFTARRLVRKNGLHVLLRAMKLVLDETEAKLVVAGDGPEWPFLKALARDLRVSEHLTFLGAVRHGVLPRYLTSSTLVVIPSYVEAFSLFMLEAMASGKPVIASSVGGMAEILTHDRTGVLVRPGDHRLLAREILRLLGDHELRATIGAEARRAVLRSYTWDIATQKYIAQFKRALESRGRG